MRNGKETEKDMIMIMQKAEARTKRGAQYNNWASHTQTRVPQKAVRRSEEAEGADAGRHGAQSR